MQNSEFKRRTEVMTMVYKCVAAKIENDGSVTEGKKKIYHQTRSELSIGGLYFIAKGKLVRVLAKVQD